MTKDWGLEQVNPLGPGHYEHTTEFRMNHRTLNSSLITSGVTTTLNTKRTVSQVYDLTHLLVKNCREKEK